MIRIIINMDCCVYTCMIFHTFYLKKNGSRKTENEVNLQGRTLSTLRLASGEFLFKFSSEIAPGRRPLHARLRPRQENNKVGAFFVARKMTPRHRKFGYPAMRASFGVYGA